MHPRFTLRLPAWLLALSCATLLAACSDSNNDTPATPPADEQPAPPETTPPIEPPVQTGAWTTGDLHAHTLQSADAHGLISLESLLDSGLNRYGLDWIAISNHLRMTAVDHTGSNIAGGPLNFSQTMALHEVPFIQSAQASGQYSGKTIFSSVEWDMPAHEHVNLGLGLNDPLSEKSLLAHQEFNYLFTQDRYSDVSKFDPALVARLGPTRYNRTHEDAMRALAWVRDNHPDSYMLLNHPSRYDANYQIADIREMNDLAPTIMFAIEGMVGNQMEPDRGGYSQTHRTYGGTDYLVAKLGGAWDALLGEGRQMWIVANSDYHFTLSPVSGSLYSSGYAPGEYAKTYLWKDGETTADLLAALRSGRMFGVFGDLIDALDFSAGQGDDTAHMGQSLQVERGTPVDVTIRFRVPETNNYEYPIGSGSTRSMSTSVDHVDLIVGEVTGRAEPGTPAYDNATNASTRVLKRFTRADWTRDEDGYYVIRHTTTANGNMYLRLRGTNLGVNVAGETRDGEPLSDPRIALPDNAHHQARFDAINLRNYSDLWFYSNPVFVSVE